MSTIPVYGLSGLEDAHATPFNLGSLAYEPGRGFGASFMRYASHISNPQRRAAVIQQHGKELDILRGIYMTSKERIKSGTATSNDHANIKKVRIMLNLDNTDYDGYRYAQIVMPYVVDVDDQSGAYCFDNYDIAIEVANGEERVIKYLKSPGATDEGYEQELQTLDGWFKKLINKIIVEPTKAVVKAVEHSITAPVQSVVNLAKGNVKEAFVKPFETVVEDSKAIAKTNYEAIKESVVISGKLFKVLLIKINPLTVLIRNAWRGLVSLNFLGMATRLGIGLLTEKQADDLGYTKETWQKAVKAIERSKKLYKNMGGNADKLVKSIKNGFNKKPLFKGDIRPDTKVNFESNEEDEGETTLGDYGVSAMITLALSVITTVWGWISSIVATRKAKKEAEAEAQRAKEEAEAAKQAMLVREKQRQAEQEAALLEEQKIYAFNENGWILDQNGQRITWDYYWALQESADGSSDTDTKKRNIIIAAVVGGTLLVGALALSGGNKHKK